MTDVLIPTTTVPSSTPNATLSALDSAFGGFPVEFALYMFVLGCLLLYQVFFHGRVMAALVSALLRRRFGGKLGFFKNKNKKKNQEIKIIFILFIHSSFFFFLQIIIISKWNPSTLL
jgi:hypothetical protein